MARAKRKAEERTGMITCGQELHAPTPRANTWRADAEDYLSRMEQGRPDLAGDPLEVVQGLMLAIETAEHVLTDDDIHGITVDNMDDLITRHVAELHAVEVERDTLQRAAKDHEDEQTIARKWRAHAEETERQLAAVRVESRDLDKALGMARTNVVDAHAELGRVQREAKISADTWRETAKAMEEQRDAARALVSPTTLGARLAEIRQDLEGAAAELASLRASLTS